jgi:hypothetical protein
MKRFFSSICLLALFVAFPMQSHAQDFSRTEAASLSLRAETSKDLLEGAAALGLDVDTENFVVASRDDGLVVNTGVKGAELLSSADLAKGATLGMVYLSGFGMQPGFYRVDVVIPEGSREGTAYLLDATGKVARVASATPTSGYSAKAKWTGSIGWSHVTVDYHGPKVSVEVTVSW